MGPQALSPECFIGQCVACYCDNACGCDCHFYEAMAEEDNFGLSLEDWYEFENELEADHNGYS